MMTYENHSTWKIYITSILAYKDIIPSTFLLTLYSICMNTVSIKKNENLRHFL